MYCSLDRFCDGLSKCHFWFASDAGTVVLCTHSLIVCVCVCGGGGGGGGRLVNKTKAIQYLLVCYLSIYLQVQFPHTRNNGL